MKKILWFALTLSGVSGLVAVAVNAANSPSPAAPSAAVAPTPGEEVAGIVAGRLGLTAEQKTKLDGLRQDQRTALGAVAGDKALSAEDRRAKVRGILEAHREQIKAVLTPDQQHQMAMARDRFANGRGHQGSRKFDRGVHESARHGSRGFGDHRADPRERRHQAMRGHMKMKHLRERRAEALGLTDEQSAKMRQIAFQYREKTIRLQKELRMEMESVLTPEQQAKAKELKAGHGRREPGRHQEGGHMRRPRSD